MASWPEDGPGNAGLPVPASGDNRPQSIDAVNPASAWANAITKTAVTNTEVARSQSSGRENTGPARFSTASKKFRAKSANVQTRSGSLVMALSSIAKNRDNHA